MNNLNNVKRQGISTSIIAVVLVVVTVVILGGVTTALFLSPPSSTTATKTTTTSPQSTTTTALNSSAATTTTSSGAAALTFSAGNATVRPFQNDITATFAVENDTGTTFYAGQVVAFNVTLTNLVSTPHTISTIAVSQLTVLSSSPILPITINGHSTEYVLVYIQVSSTAFTGTPSVLITMSS